MFFATDKTFLSFGIATMIVVGVAMLGSLTVLPALLSRLGDQIDRGRIPFLHRYRDDASGSRFWQAVLGPDAQAPGGRGDPRRRRARAARAPGAPDAHVAKRFRGATEERADRRDDPARRGRLLERNVRRRSSP